MKTLLCSFIFWITPLFISPYSQASSSNEYVPQVKTILAGDTIFSLLAKNGFSNKERNRIFGQQALPKELLLVPGHRYLSLKTSKKLKLKLYNHETDLTYTFWKNDQKVGIQSSKGNFQIQTVRVSGEVDGSLISSIKGKINETLVAYRFMDAFLLDYNLKKDIQKGARFRLIVEKQFDQNHFIKFGDVLLATLEIKNKLIQKIFIPFTQKNGSGGSFVSSEDLSSSKPFYSPVDTIRISSLFQPRRHHPIKKRRQAHLGIDFALPTTSPVYAVANGRIVKTGRGRATGKYIVVQHQGHMKTYYNHLSKINHEITSGTSVKAGQPIGEIGCTGYCTKPHLHFAIRKGTRMVNPINYIKGYPAHAEKQLKKSFQKITKQIKKDSWKKFSRTNYPKENTL